MRGVCRCCGHRAHPAGRCLAVTETRPDRWFVCDCEGVQRRIRRAR